MTQFSVFSQLMDRALERSLPANIVEKDAHFDILVKVPGIASKDIVVDIQGRFVKVSVQRTLDAVSGEHDPSVENQDKSASPERVVHLAEFDVPAKAERSFQFRETLDAEGAVLDLTDGILKITVSYLQRGTKRTLKVGE